MSIPAQEHDLRLQIFADTHDFIEAHNADVTATYRLGHNKFSHLTMEEFSTDNLSPKPYLNRQSNPIHHKRGISPSAWDWAAQGAVTSVKDQGKCSTGGWSFSVVGSIEGAYFIFSGQNTTSSLSNQQLISCDTTNTGCAGGWMDNSFNWVKSNGGLCTDADYPWVSGSTGLDGTCDTSCTVSSAYAPTSYTDVTQGSVSDLQDAIYRQPVSIAIQANQISIKQYKSGVFTGACGQHLDHGCLAVGYGTDASVTKDYWNVKNSWGTAWGEAGYIRIEKSDADRCGVLDLPSYPNL